MHILIGIDDTDNLESHGTGHRARQLADWLAQNDLAKPRGITRHQLLVDSQIPFTSHNSSICLSAEADRLDEVWKSSREFLLQESAAGSNAGLCLAKWDMVNECVISFAKRAKLTVLTMFEAEQTASGVGVQCEGLTGTGGGIIGALSAIGLHRAGNDGRYLWLPGLRELKSRIPVQEICERGHVDRVCTLSHANLHTKTIIHIGEWVRPILRDGKATLYVEEINHEWRVIPKEYIKKLSN